MFAAAGIPVIGLDAAGIPASDDEEAIEAHATFEANALAKARHFHRVSGLRTVADDSGLEVDALDGAPGVYSKRWSGVRTPDAHALDAANNAYLLERLRGVERRTARFVCVAALADAGGVAVARGEVAGIVATSLRGSGGFGYDACFIPHEGDGRTFAEMPSSAKAALSHRARAFDALLRAMAQRA